MLIALSVGDFDVTTHAGLGIPGTCPEVDEIRWQTVPMPFEEDMEARLAPGSGSRWAELSVRFNLHPIEQAEVQHAGLGGWWPTLTWTNHWTFANLPGPVLLPLRPLSVRLTDVHGHVVVAEDVITSWSDDVWSDLAKQFPQAP